MSDKKRRDDMRMISDLLPDITRVDIIGNTVHEFWADEWMVALQDDGRTLKLFPIGDGVQTKYERDVALVSSLKEAIASKREGLK